MTLSVSCPGRSFNGPFVCSCPLAVAHRLGLPRHLEGERLNARTSIPLALPPVHRPTPPDLRLGVCADRLQPWRRCSAPRKRRSSRLRQPCRLQHRSSRYATDRALPARRSRAGCARADLSRPHHRDRLPPARARRAAHRRGRHAALQSQPQLRPRQPQWQRHHRCRRPRPHQRRAFGSAGADHRPRQLRRRRLRCRRHHLAVYPDRPPADAAELPRRAARHQPDPAASRAPRRRRHPAADRRRPSPVQPGRRLGQRHHRRHWRRHRHAQLQH